MTDPDANTQDTRPAVTTHPLLGRGAAVLALQVRRQVYKLAISESFHSSYMLRGLPHRSCLHVQSAYPISAGHCCTSGGQMRNTFHERGQIMISTSAARRELRAAVSLWLPFALLCSTFITTSVAQQASANPMQLTLEQAIDLSLKQNRSIHLRRLSVEQMQSQRDEARSNYLPQIKASGNVLHVTELAGVEIPAGAFGSYGSTGPAPPQSLFVDQGSLTGYVGGVGLEQPLTQLFRIRQANVSAKADVLVAKTQLEETQDVIALQVRQLYYNILINQQKLRASEDQLGTAQVKDAESRSDVTNGTALEISALQSKAAILQAQQDSLTLRLQGGDLRRRLAVALGLPVDTPLELDPGAAAFALDIPTRADAIRIALERNQDLRAARQTLIKAQAGLAAAKDAYIPDLTALSRYSYQSGVPFLVHNFGTFGVSLSYDLFDGGRREARVREARSEVRSAEVTVDKLQSEIEVEVHGIYDKVDELRQMVDVAGQVVATRTEAARLSDRQFEQTAALSSARSQSHADLANAAASLLEANCGLALAEADLKRAVGQMPQ
jgi:outer membrane protein TolC